MANISASASLASAYYVSWPDWNNTTGPAHQGEYNGGYSRVGIMAFSDLGTTLKGRSIRSITLEPTIQGGSNGAGRTITFYSSNYQYISTSITGDKYPGAQMGTLVGNGVTGTGTASTYPGKQKFVLSSSTNSSLFSAWAARLAAGDTTFLIYNGETSNAAGYSYSANYLGFSAVTITVEYDTDYTVTYNANGHGTAPQPQNVSAGSAITLPTVEADGYRFCGWSTTPTADMGMTGSYTPTGNVTLYAVWKKLHTVQYQTDGIGQPPDAVEVMDGESVALPTVKAAGYGFLGWSDTQGGREPVEDPYYPAGDVTLYAIWQRLYSLIRYVVNGEPVRCRVEYVVNGQPVRCRVKYVKDGSLVDI